MAVESRWFAEQGRQFSQHESQVRGYIRYAVTRHNLQATLAGYMAYPRKAIDVGGGEGHDAIWLASLNPSHDVVLVEPSEDYIAYARANGGADLGEIVQGDTNTALSKYGAQSFELLLFHGVLQYLPNPQEELMKLASLVKPGGYISLLTPGKLGKLKRFTGDNQKIDRLVATGKYTNNLGAESTAYLPQEIITMLQKAGLETKKEDWFGVRLFSDDDDRETASVPAFHLNRLLDKEITGSRDPRIRPVGQMLHFIARKNA